MLIDSTPIVTESIHHIQFSHGGTQTLLKTLDIFILSQEGTSIVLDTYTIKHKIKYKQFYSNFLEAH